MHAVVFIGLELSAPGRRPHIRDALLVSVLGAIPALSSLSYAPLSAIVYLWFGVIALRAGLRDAVPRRALVRDAGRTIGILLVPYLLLVGYLVASGSVSAFVDQAIVFNTRYYSQFTSDVSQNLGQTLLTPFMAFAKTYGATLTSLSGVTLRHFLVAVGLLAALAVFVIRRRYLLAGFGLALVITGSYRFQAPERVFSDPSARFGTYAFLTGLLCVMALWMVVNGWSRKQSRPARPVAWTLAAVCTLGLLVPVVVGAGGSVNVARQFRHGAVNTLQLNDAGGERAAVINAVVTPGDRYFVGPFDFYTQLYLQGTRSSLNTFYLPWHGVCESCVAALDRSLRTDKPLAIAWAYDTNIWGRSVDSYAPKMLTLLDHDYFAVADPRAHGVYFLTAEKDLVVERLRAAGIDATLAPSPQ
jgi:hypothetical protein